MRVFKQIPLYRFLDFCNTSSLEKTVLDCGAGGVNPPLSLFAEHGFNTTGVEFDSKQLKRASEFGVNNGQALGVVQGDMRELSFQDESISFVYSYNSVFHMKKVDVKKSVDEMIRVLKPGGLLFVNFLTTNDFRCGEGPCVGPNEYEQMDDEPVIHSYYEPNEADIYFEDMEVLFKEDRVLERIYEGDRIRQGFVDYILRKRMD